MKHGLWKSRTYKSWISMISRCNNPNAPNYHNYGGRGIKVCPEWLEFQNFYKDMGGRPDGKSLDRIDSNGNYEPANCRWATSQEQNRNSSNNVMITFGGETLCLQEWSERTGLRRKTLAWRISRGWQIERLFSEAGPSRISVR